jgi:hypothetical protein
MRKIFAVAGTFALVFGVLTECVEAKTMAFEVAGRRYSYETSKVQQVAAARKLIEVANAADAAKATADAEREANPLVKIIGSPAQKAATEAQARLAEAIATYEQETAAMQRQPASPDVGAGKRGSATRERAGLRTTPAPSGQADTSKDEPAAPKVSQEATAARSTSSNPVQPQPAVKNVFTDVSSGIKTIFMTDGSIREEPVNGSKSSISSDGGDASASTGSINRAR